MLRILVAQQLHHAGEIRIELACRTLLKIRVCDTPARSLIRINSLPNEPESRFVNSERKDFLSVARTPPASMDKRVNGNRSVPGHAAQLVCEREGDLSVWVRAPKRGPEFYSGCSRPKLYEWAAKGFIRSVSIREPGRVKGVRLFHLASILAFIERCEAGAFMSGTRRQTHQNAVPGSGHD